jgi:SH3-like domain-containing protein
MSRHNYSQYSNYKKHNDTTEETAPVTSEVKMEVETFETSAATTSVAVETPETVTVTEPALVQETVETVQLPETVTGTVVDCAKLNVRVEPSIDGNVICVLSVKTDVEINVDKSTDEWYSIRTMSGVEGYCMKKFVNARL